MFGRKPQRVEISTDAYREIMARLVESGVQFSVDEGAIELGPVAFAQEPVQEQPAPASGVAGHRPLSTVTVKIPRKRAE